MRVAVLAALALVAAGCGSGVARQTTSVPRPASTFAGTPVPADTPAADFSLRDQNGHLVRLSAQRGRLVFVAFLYSHCPDVCPLIATWLDGAIRALGPDARNVRVLAVSVDPSGDTPAAVREVIRTRHLGSEFHWLLGTREQLAPVWQSYNILVEPHSLEKIAHAAPVFLLDRRGRPRVFYAEPQGRSAFLHDARLLLQR
jgi:protein SCO1/2